MKKEYLNVLACIRCKKSDLSLISTTPDVPSVEEGIIQCQCCSEIYPIIGGIPCFLPTELMDEHIKERLNSLKETLLVTIKQ